MKASCNLPGRALDWRLLPAPPRAPRAALALVPVTRDAFVALAAQWKTKGHPLALALRSVTKGDPYATEGAREQTTWALVQAIAREMPACAVESIEALFAPSWSQWQDMRNDEPPAAKFERALRLAEEEPEEVEQHPPAVMAAIAAQPKIVQRGRTFWLLAGPGQWRRYSLDDVAGAIPRDLGPAGLDLMKVSGRGEPMPKSPVDLVREYGAVAEHHSLTYNEETHYDYETRTFVELAASRRVIEPAFAQDVHDWLCALFGPKVEEGHAWLAWLLRLDTPCSMLVLLKTPGTGKSLLIGACAEFWHGRPTELETALDAFNDATSCPLVVGDETIPKDFRGRHKTAELRRLIQENGRTIRRKFMSDAFLKGSYRIIHAANGSNPLALEDALDENDIRGIAERWLVIETQPAAVPLVNALVAAHGRDAARRRVAQHIAYVQANMTWTPRGRFVTHSGAESDLVRKMTALAPSRSAILRWLWGYAARCGGKSPPPVNAEFCERVPGAIAVRAEALESHWTMFVPNDKPPSTAQLGRALTELAQRQERRRGTRWHIVPRDRIIAWAEATGFADVEEVIEKIP